MGILCSFDNKSAFSSDPAPVKPESHLENSLPLLVVGEQVVPPAELVIFGQIVPAHGSATKKRGLVVPLAKNNNNNI